MPKRERGKITPSSHDLSTAEPPGEVWKWLAVLAVRLIPAVGVVAAGLAATGDAATGDAATGAAAVA